MKHIVSIGVHRVYNVTVEASNKDAAHTLVQEAIDSEGLHDALKELDAQECSLCNDQDVFIQVEETIE